MNELKKIFLYGFLITTGIITVLPFVWMLSASFMSDGSASVFPPVFFPYDFTWVQYESLFTRLSIVRNFLNSILLSVIVTLISLFFNSMAAFARKLGARRLIIGAEIHQENSFEGSDCPTIDMRMCFLLKKVAVRSFPVTDMETYDHLYPVSTSVTFLRVCDQSASSEK